MIGYVPEEITLISAPASLLYRKASACPIMEFAFRVRETRRPTASRGQRSDFQETLQWSKKSLQSINQSKAKLRKALCQSGENQPPENTLPGPHKKWIV